MISWVSFTNYAITGAALAISLLGLLLVLRMSFIRDLDPWSSRFFTWFFIVLVAYTASNCVDQMASYVIGLENLTASKLALFFTSFFASMLMPWLSILMLHYLGEDHEGHPLIITVSVLWIIYVVLLVITQFTEFIYYFSPETGYHRGSYYPVLLVPPALIMALNLIVLLKKRRRMNSRVFGAFLFYFLTPLVCMLIQMAVYGLLMIVLGTTVSAFVMFLMLMNDQDESMRESREREAEQKASIAVLQMRPHFIYNTLMSIYYLCGIDPAKAQKVILDFSSYLRKNFTAIAGERTIPFSEELEHTRAYLAVETVRFSDFLSVEFDTPHVNFRIPPLTLQPLVENAVKHGLDPDSSPLHILVRSYDTDDCNVIMVEDNGTGFDSSTAPEASEIRGPEGSEPHVALDNIRVRLGMLCRGTLEIGPRKEGGTSVTIRIPH